MRIGHFHRHATVALIVATALSTPLTAWANAAGAYYDRSFVLAAHRKCSLFAPGVVSALTTSALQARGAAVRAGVAEDALTATAARARARASSTDCNDPQLRLVRTRVTSAFEGWATLAKMTFPGGRSDWLADRSTFSSPTWRLMQASVTGASPVSFGMAASPDGTEQVQAVVSFVGKPRPYAARIVLRDSGRLARPLPAALPPETSRQAFWALANADAQPTLLPTDRKQGQAWAFPDASADALARLDPREPFVIEFLFRDDSVARATFQAGDFAAGRAFVAMGRL
ncbi:MAG: hypothetical protein DCF28_03230 [Alphaproteobacteria bacterium]|nr:MAG: hypothetical protein DCF28_03230 [Alphaproteobacteria bacterium]PZO38981.1 MAG: hypothetical protein DCE92_05020 [Alphaproteobacteria bacterium]